MRIIKPSKRPGKGQLTSRTVSSQTDHAPGSAQSALWSEAESSESFLNPSSPTRVSKKKKIEKRVTREKPYSRKDSELGADSNLCKDIDESANIQRKKNYNDLLAKGIRLLAMREHSVSEISEKLRSKTEFVSLVPAVVEELLTLDYLSDERFAESYVRSRRNRGFGPVKIRSELIRKGVDTVLIGEYLEPQSAVWLEIAKEQYHKKYGDAVVCDYNAWSKRARFMQSRGFTMDHIQNTLPEVEFD